MDLERSTAQRQELAALFDKVRVAVAKRPEGSGSAATIQFLIGDEAWVVDTQGPPDQSVRAGQADDADCTITLSAETFSGLLDGSLPPLRAWAQRRISISGDRKHLRALDWMAVGGGPQRSALGGATVNVRSSSAGTGHGTYEVVVTEEAACWTVWRRWRELTLMAADLAASYGPSTAYNLVLPPLPRHSLRSSGSTTLLPYRQRVMQEYLSAVLELLPTSPRSGRGPPPLLLFLESCDACNDKELSDQARSSDLSGLLTCRCLLLAARLPTIRFPLLATCSFNLVLLLPFVLLLNYSTTAGFCVELLEP